MWFGVTRYLGAKTSALIVKKLFMHNVQELLLVGNNNFDILRGTDYRRNCLQILKNDQVDFKCWMLMTLHIYLNWLSINFQKLLKNSFQSDLFCNAGIYSTPLMMYFVISWSKVLMTSF